MEIVTQNATSLAWIGDALMTLYVREYLLGKGYQKPDLLQKKSSHICSAKAQSTILHQMLEEDYFTSEEKEILHRGRNATIHSKAKNATHKEYLEATALEAVLGYMRLYHHDDRLQDILQHIVELGAVL